MTSPVVFKVYICQGPEKHVGHRPSVLNSADGSPLCRDCTWPVDEVEVVRVCGEPIFGVSPRGPRCCGESCSIGPISHRRLSNLKPKRFVPLSTVRRTE